MLFINVPDDTAQSVSDASQKRCRRTTLLRNVANQTTSSGACIRTKSWHVRGCCCLFLLMAGCAVSGPAFAQGTRPDARLDSVFKDWQARQKILKSARYVLKGTREFRDPQLPVGNPIRPYNIVFLLDLERKRYRLESSEEMFYCNGSDDPKKWEWRKFTHTSAYDGELLQELSHRKANGIQKDREDDLSIGKGNLGPLAQFPGEVWPIFFAHGVVPTVNVPLLLEKWPLAHDADDFNIVGWQLLRGQNCLLLRTDPLPGTSPISDEFWVHPKQQSAIHRHVYFSGSNPWTLCDISWKNMAYGWWIDQWSETWYKHGPHARRVTRFRVDAFEANPEVSDSDFKLPAEPGMIVQVSEAPPPGKGLKPFMAASKTYRVSPSGSWDEIAAKGFTTLDGKELPPEGGIKRWLAWSIAAGLAMGLLLAYVSRKRWKRAIS